jgi:hypothetical protein
MRGIADESFLREGSSSRQLLLNNQSRRAAQEFLDSKMIVSEDDIDSLKQVYASTAGVDLLLQNIGEEFQRTLEAL